MPTIEMVWKNYHARLRAFIARRIDNQAQVDDLLQEVFLKIHRQLGGLNEERKLAAWLFQITRNTLNDHYRATRPRHGTVEELDSPPEETAELARRELESCFLPMIESLPDKYRTPVRLSEIEGMTQDSVARELGLSLAATKSRIQRGRTQIRGMMESCCQFEFDHQGRVTDYDKKSGGKEFC